MLIIGLNDLDLKGRVMGMTEAITQSVIDDFHKKLFALGLPQANVGAQDTRRGTVVVSCEGLSMLLSAVHKTSSVGRGRWSSHILDMIRLGQILTVGSLQLVQQLLTREVIVRVKCLVKDTEAAIIIVDSRCSTVGSPRELHGAEGIDGRCLLSSKQWRLLPIIKLLTFGSLIDFSQNGTGGSRVNWGRHKFW